MSTKQTGTGDAGDAAATSSDNSAPIERPRARPRGIPFGDPRHPLSAKETARRGAYAAAAVKRERSKSVGERFRDKLEAEAEDLYTTLRDAWRGGDWRALVAALDRAYGRPPQAIVGDDSQPVAIRLVSAFTIDGEAGLDIEGADTVDLEHGRRQLEPGEGQP